jgi:ribosome-associated translation inhibitor RaiA
MSDERTLTSTETAPSPADAQMDVDWPIELSVSNGITDDERARAVQKTNRVLDGTGRRVLHVRIRLERSADPARDRPSHALVSADLDGDVVRAHVAASTTDEAIDLLEARLRQRLERLASHRRALRRRGTTSQPGEWRHGDLPTERPSHYPRPVEDREIVRHKSFTGTASVDEAIFDLESFDYDFFLFTDVTTGQDALVERREGGSYGVRYLDGADDRLEPTAHAAAVDAVEHRAPPLTLEQAREHLDVAHEPWVFFCDASSGRGHVLYRRYDGH